MGEGIRGMGCACVGGFGQLLEATSWVYESYAFWLLPVCL